MLKVIEKCPKPKIDTGCTFCKINWPAPIRQDELNNTKVSPWKHVMVVSHGYKDFNTMPAKIDMVAGLAQEIAGLRHLRSAQHPVLVTNVIIDGYKEERRNRDNELVYLYPEAKRVEFNRRDVEGFVKRYLRPAGVKPEPVYDPFRGERKEKEKEKEEEEEKVKNEKQRQNEGNEKQRQNKEKQTEKQRQNKNNTTGNNSDLGTNPAASTGFIESPLCHRLTLVCGHTQRDSRCGVVAPHLLNELKAIINPNTDKIGTISHIGGHAYAGNLLMYPEDLWYGRVTPDKIQGLHHSRLQGQIISSLYRGDMSDARIKQIH